MKLSKSIFPGSAVMRFSYLLWLIAMVGHGLGASPAPTLEVELETTPPATQPTAAITSWAEEFSGWNAEMSTDLNTWTPSPDFPFFDGVSLYQNFDLGAAPTAFFRLRELGPPLDFEVPVTPGLYRQQGFMHGGRVRHYILLIPGTYAPAAGARPGIVPAGGTPLMVMCHGSGQTADAFFDLHPDLRARCEAEGWILVLPDGTVAPDGDGRSWNSQPWYDGGRPDDVAFIKDLIGHLAENLVIDERRIHAAGFSNGGVFVHRLGAMTAGLFAATAHVAAAGTAGVPGDPSALLYPPMPADPPATLIVNSRLDPKRPFTGGVNIDGQLQSPSFEAAEWWNYWKGMRFTPPVVTAAFPATPAQANAAFNAAPPLVKPSSAAVLAFADSVKTSVWTSPGARETRFVELTLAGHVWPDAADNVNYDANREVIEFFKANPRLPLAAPPASAPVPVPASFTSAVLAGVPVVYHVPVTAAPTGVILVCHPEGRDESFVEHPEMVEILLEAAKEGFAFLSVKSDGALWDTATDPATNPDVVRCLAALEALKLLSPTLASVPVLTYGHGAGAPFALLLAPPAAARGVAVSSLDTREPLPPLAAATLEGSGINICFIAGENDQADPSLIAAQFAAEQVRNGNYTGDDQPHFLISPETDLAPNTLERVPGVGPGLANSTFTQLVALGHVDVTGKRLVSAETLAADLGTMVLPPALGALDPAVRDELASVWGLGFPSAAIRYGFRDFCLEASVAETAAPTPPPAAPRADPGPFVAVLPPVWNTPAAGGGPWNSGPGNTFAGFPTLYHVPLNPDGLVFLFHGTNGGAFFGDSYDTREYINDLVARGFAVVCTESTDRKGGFEQGAQWDKVAVNDDGTPNFANPDYQRMKDIRDWLIANTGANGVTAATKLFSMGYSNGAEFCVAFSLLAHQEGLPVAGTALHAVGAGDADVRRAMRRLPPTLPIFWCVLENDHRVPKLAERLEEIQLLRGAAAAPLEDRLGLESKIDPQRFLRVRHTTMAQADAAFAELVSRGAIDAGGARIVAADVFESKLKGLPSPAPGYAEDVARVAGALHQVSGEFVIDQNDLFDAFAP